MIVCLEWIGLSAEQVSLHVALANLKVYQGLYV